MAGNILAAPAEVTKLAIRTTTGSGRLARRLGGNIVQRASPGYIPSEVQAQQDILRLFKFKHGFGVIGNLIEPESSSRELKLRVSSAADDMVGKGFVDEHTTVELRPILPADALRDPELNRRREAVVELLGRALDDRGVGSVITNSHPIMPSEHEQSVEIATVWGTIAAELDGFSHQIREESQSRLAMLAISGTPYAQRIFGNQVVNGGHGDRLAQNELLVLGHVGRLPPGNRLIGARPGISENVTN